MTTRQYELIARQLAETKPSERRKWSFKQWKKDVDGMADLIASQNVRFDRDKFNADCGR